MCSSDLGLCDFLLDREDVCIAAEKCLRNSLFETSLNPSSPHFLKDNAFDSTSGLSDWKNVAETFDPDDFLRTVFDGATAVLPERVSSPMDEDSHPMDDVLSYNEDLPQDLVGLPFDAVFDSAASDSGVSSDGGSEHQLSPSSRPGFLSPDSQDTASDVSCASDLGSLPSTGYASPASSEPTNCYTSPEVDLAQISSDDDIKEVPPPKEAKPIISEKIHVANFTPNHVSSSTPSFFKVQNPLSGSTQYILQSRTLPLINGKTPLLAKVKVENSDRLTSTSGQRIVVTQAGKTLQTPIRKGTFLKTANGTRSFLLTGKDLNQVRTIKIISTGHPNGTKTAAIRPGVKTIVSGIRGGVPVSDTRTTIITSGNQKGETRSFLKVPASSLVNSPVHNGQTTILSPSTIGGITMYTPIKEEPNFSDDETPQPYQEIILSDEERRLLKKESISLPSHYPLTKTEERDLKRIRRKIRNKISAQDSRKRKKEYIDGLEDRVKSCTDENQQLQKRIKHLETQNETLVNQLKRFQSLFGNSVSGSTTRNPGHASTALMMLILSAALFIVPSIRPQDKAGTENELSGSSKIPSAGNSRSLLEAANQLNLVVDAMEGLKDEGKEFESNILPALSDHDYAPSTKRQKFSHDILKSYYVPPIDDYLPSVKADPDGGPPDGTGGFHAMTAMWGAVMNHLGSNWTDPGGPKTRSVVVNFNDGRLRDDLELE